MKKLLISFCALFVSTVLFAQNITTASAYFKTISEYYGTIKDYEVDFEIKIEKTESAGKLSFKAPNLVRMDYTNPEEQVICFNGDMLTIYIKEPAEAVLQQQVRHGAPVRGPGGIVDDLLLQPVDQPELVGGFRFADLVAQAPEHRPQGQVPPEAPEAARRVSDDATPRMCSAAHDGGSDAKDWARWT